ncbi:hypothetical protein [Helicobacter bizzozeronii]|uniref:hypothetical protein n=1 Tax=Helicobacter bizzozeronii TaxID=56877 RepID=UPI0013158121|nr:hypothetical protein [Helicobacter bizzozeronii]
MQTYATHDPKLDTFLKQALSYQLFRSLSDIQDWGFCIDRVFVWINQKRLKTPS